MAYADDLVIISRSKKNLKEVVSRLEEKARGKGMQINESKTKYVMDRQKIR